MISKPRTALGGGLLAAVLLVSGCQSRVGSAATVGGSTISTDTLATAYREAAATSSGKAEGAKLQSDILTQLVQLQAYREVARRERVTVPQGNIDDAYQRVVASDSSAAPQTPQAYRRQAEIQATEIALASHFVDVGGKVDSVELYGVPVKDTATANTVLAKLKADLGNATVIAQNYSNISQVAEVGGQLGAVSIGNSGLPQAATAKVNEPFVATVSGTTAVFMVEARLDGTDLQAAITKDAPVKINPRFGTWGTVTDATSGAKSLGVVSLASDVVAPGPSVAPSASAPAPSAAAPSAAAPFGTRTCCFCTGWVGTVCGAGDLRGRSLGQQCTGTYRDALGRSELLTS